MARAKSDRVRQALSVSYAFAWIAGIGGLPWSVPWLLSPLCRNSLRMRRRFTQRAYLILVPLSYPCFILSCWSAQPEMGWAIPRPP